MPPPTTELRVDPLTGRQVIVAAARSQRPVTAASRLPTANDQDPFLEGHERETPSESLALRRVDTDPDQAGWLLRVVPNRYPAVISANAGDAAALCGSHDVVIECPDGRQRLAELSVTEIARILLAWQARWQTLMTDDCLQAVAIFRNEGSRAGASLAHCHSQILATDFIGHQLRQRVARATEYSQRNDGSLFAHWLKSERAAEQRIIHDDSQFVTVCPYASRVDYHIRMAPATPELSAYEQLSQSSLCALAERLRLCALSLDSLNAGPDYNLTLILPPTQNAAAFPWMLDVLPRRNSVAGFELLSDTDILTTTPEHAAEQLRTVMDSAPRQELAADSNLICPPGFHWVSSQNS